MSLLNESLTFKRIKPCPECIVEREYSLRKHVITFQIAVMEFLGCGEAQFLKEVEKILMEDLEKEFSRFSSKQS